MLGRPLEQVKERACEGKERFTTSDWVGVESHVNLGEAGSRPQGSLGKEKGRCRARGERTRQQGQEAVDSVAPYRAIVGFQLSLCLTWRVAKFSFVQMYQDHTGLLCPQFILQGIICTFVALLVCKHLCRVSFQK